MWKKLIAAALVLAALTGCAAKSSPQPSPSPTAEPTAIPQTAEPAEAPETAAADETAGETERPMGVMSDFAAEDLHGNRVDAQAAFGEYRLTMVNVWGTFCGPCISEMPDLGELSKELEAKNVRIVGIVSDAMDFEGGVNEEIRQTALEIVEQTGADYLHLLPSEDLYGLLFQISAVPTTFFVNSYGCQVGIAYAGARDKETWAAIVDDTLLSILEE